MNLRGIIFDVDGVLEYQGKVYPGAVETVAGLRRAGMALRFVTNSTLKSRASCAEKLARAGFPVQVEEVITASSASAAYLRGQKPKTCWVMVERAGLDEFREFAQDTERPEWLVVGDNRSQFDFDHLNRALRALKRGARLLGMQSELVDASMGELELNVGSWVGMLERASGVPAIYIGKPNPFVYELALRSMGLEKGEVIGVGDRVSSDIKGARDFGIRSLLLRTGEFAERDLELGIAPDFVCDAIGEIPAALGFPGTWGEEDADQHGVRG